MKDMPSSNYGSRLAKQYKTYRPKVSKETTDGELFNIMCEMLKPLRTAT